MRMLPSLPTLTPCLVPALKSAAEVRCVIWGLAEAALAGVVGASTTSPTARAQPSARPRLRRLRIETPEPGTREVAMGSSLGEWSDFRGVCEEIPSVVGRGRFAVGLRRGLCGVGFP